MCMGVFTLPLSKLVRSTLISPVSYTNIGAVGTEPTFLLLDLMQLEINFK